MTASDRILSVNDRLVASDIVDGEAVIINLGNGTYFTMDKVGAEVWQLLSQPRSLAGMAAILARRYRVAEGEVLRDLEDVAGELLREQLVVVSHDAGGGTGADGAAADPAPQPSYSRPVLMKYTDMSDVLALDPPLPELDADVPRQS